MKPSWSDAPKWANWLAKDKSGEWYWYENEPNCFVSVLGENRLNPDLEWWATGRHQLAEDDIYWQSSLEQRPKEDS